MTTDTRTPHGRATDIMASVDEGEESDNLVIADVTCDEAWISVATAGAATLQDWR